MISFIDYTELIKYFCPDLYNHYLPNDKKMNDIANKFNKRVSFYIEQVSNNKLDPIKTTFFDLIRFANQGEQAAIDFLNFINNIAKELNSIIPVDLHDSIKNIFLELFQNFDNSDSKYLDRIGELVVLNKITKSPKLVLNQVEHKLSNGNSFDFSFKQNKYPEITLLVEVMNIHLNTSKLEENKKFKIFLERRLVDKYESKLTNYKMKKNETYRFISLIWCDVDKIVKYREVFKSIQDSTIFDTMGLVQISNQNNFVYHLDSMTNIIDKYNNDSKH